MTGYCFATEREFWVKFIQEQSEADKPWVLYNFGLFPVICKASNISLDRDCLNLSDRWIAERGKTKNLKLYFPFNHVHTPDFTTMKHQNSLPMLYSDCNTSRRGRFGDAIEEMDWVIGQVMDAFCAL